jgi:hypothetical protein
MLNHESAAEPLGIGLNMLVDPFLCPLRQRAEQEHSSFITHQYIGRSFGLNFHVTLFLQVLSACRIRPGGLTTVTVFSRFGWGDLGVPDQLLMLGTRLK